MLILIRSLRGVIDNPDEALYHQQVVKDMISSISLYMWQMIFYCQDNTEWQSKHVDKLITLLLSFIMGIPTSRYTLLLL